MVRTGRTTKTLHRPPRRSYLNRNRAFRRAGRALPPLLPGLSRPLPAIGKTGRRRDQPRPQPRLSMRRVVHSNQASDLSPLPLTAPQPAPTVQLQRRNRLRAATLAARPRLANNLTDRLGPLETTMDRLPGETPTGRDQIAAGAANRCWAGQPTPGTRHEPLIQTTRKEAAATSLLCTGLQTRMTPAHRSLVRPRVVNRTAVQRRTIRMRSSSSTLHWSTYRFL